MNPDGSKERKMLVRPERAGQIRQGLRTLTQHFGVSGTHSAGGKGTKQLN